MVNVKEKDNGSTSIPNPEKDSTKTAVTETAVSETKTILEKTVAVSETEERVEQITEEAKTEENTSEEKDNGANAEEEEADEENDEEGTNEENSQEGEGEGEEEEEEEEEENKDDNPIEEEIAEEKKEEENSDNNPMEEDIDEEKKEEEMKEEKAEPVSKEPVKKSRKRSRNKVVAAKDQDKPESSVKRTPAKKAKTVAAKDEDGPVSTGKKMPSTKAKTVGGAESSGRKKPPKEGKHTPESSGKKKPLKKMESMGMIFMCSSKTKKDCYRYKVLGLPASKKETVQKIYKGMRLFLYDVDLKMMYGIYKAAAPGGFNIEPKAFNSAYPSQVRFTVLEECEPLGEEKFKKVIKENYFSKNKFDCQLNSEQVKNLCKLFAFASKGTPKSKKAARSAKAEPRPSSGRGRIRRGVRDEPRPRSPRGPPRGARRYNDRPMVYEREAFVPPMHNVRSLPARVPAPPLPYAYEMDAYGRDPPPEHRGRPFLDYELDRYNYREQEPLSYRDPVYSAGRPREYNYAPPAEYNYAPPPALPSRYHYPDPASDYRSSVGVRAEYHIPAEGRRADYRSSARDRVYRL